MVRPVLTYAFVALLVGGCGGGGGSGSRVSGVRGSAVIQEVGWSVPVKLRFNDDGWEDSPYITRDGQEILFFYHPFPDLITKLDEATASGIDGKIYISDRPFVEKRIHPISTPDAATECCPYLSLSGELFYTSNLRSFQLQEDVPESIYIDGRRIDLGTNVEESNPHYCAARDELWFDCPGDTRICLVRNARADGFRGPAEVVSAPINHAGGTDSQPYLTDDCEVLYFTSNRAGGDRPQIFKSVRTGGGWSEPQLFISEPSGVGELSMTADGRELVFAQIFDRVGGGVGIDIYYAKKKR